MLSSRAPPRRSPLQVKTPWLLGGGICQRREHVKEQTTVEFYLKPVQRLASPKVSAEKPYSVSTLSRCCPREGGEQRVSGRETGRTDGSVDGTWSGGELRHAPAVIGAETGRRVGVCCLVWLRVNAIRGRPEQTKVRRSFSSDKQRSRRGRRGTADGAAGGQ